MATGDARPRSKKRKPRQEISAFLKWTVFLFNFLVFVSKIYGLPLSGDQGYQSQMSLTPNSVNEGHEDHLLRSKQSARKESSEKRCGSERLA